MLTFIFGSPRHNAQEQASNVQQKSATTTSSTKQQKRKKIIDSENLEQPQTSIDIPSTFASKENFTPQEMTCTTQDFVEKSTQEKNLEVQPIIFKWSQNLVSGQKVEICGSWDNWSQKIPLNEKPEADGYVFTALHLKPGKNFLNSSKN
uniref:5'-AMP-activated protein kinase subunit beta-1 n=1 Tax=Acrobeloides nanus TaxID=290746 RepID=A0A914D639_9BILA